MPDLRRLAARATCALSLASLGYTAFALVRTLAFAKRPLQPATRAPHVTILKPLHGDEPLLVQKLASFCDQEYPHFDVVMGTRAAGDVALEAARAVARDHPGIATVVHAAASTPHYPNPKAATLAALVPHARGEIIVFADSDMRVTPEYLLAVAAPFEDPAVGAVTCLYRGEPAGGGAASALGAMANHEHFAPSVLVAESLMGMRFGFGATIAVRRALFERIGGLAAIGSHIADDATLCRLVREAGFRVVLSRYVVENVVDEPTLAALWEHELRWARTHRALEPAGYAGLAITYPIPLALLHLALARNRAKALAVVAAAFALRFALSAATRAAFGVRSAPQPLLIPLRDAFGLAVWAAAFASRRVAWSGETLALADNGTVTRAGR
ncbi:glycosyl transferase [Vulcanimicrobium alpinum]|uniref:Glycosyl transferase n=1 Tax=Vulcanimicrobium alpinum TaxID=3016050 RepID=A0AAN1XXI9_UNVUL|nr:bacteriohopanetetrol glucosamine biosynthesis glycosyltransferase HpnI [Vulcanimicrobium alpinum]BDE07235.1 glycosyl transferase [Vulcanimicrobium alpinum]